MSFVFEQNAGRNLVDKYEGERWFPSRSLAWKDNIKINLPTVVWEFLIDVAQYRHKWWAFVNAVMNLPCSSCQAVFPVEDLLLQLVWISVPRLGEVPASKPRSCIPHSLQIYQLSVTYSNLGPDIPAVSNVSQHYRCNTFFYRLPCCVLSDLATQIHIHMNHRCACHVCSGDKLRSFEGQSVIPLTGATVLGKERCCHI